MSRGTRRRRGGFTYLALLVAVVIIGISLGAAGKYWSNTLLREKEEELLFRGMQYRTALEHYYKARTPHVFPQSVEQLLKDDRSAKGMRHLRQRFTDPVSGSDFVEIRDPQKGNRITGFHSPSDRKPLKQGGFPPALNDFGGKGSYAEWKFVFTPPSPQPPPAARPR